MSRTIHKTENPVTLDGYQAILAPSKYGYSASAIICDDMVSTLTAAREDNLKWATSKLKHPKRATCKPEPWEEVAEGQYKVKFSWNEDTRPPVVDTEGTLITDEKVPLYSGSQVKLAFYQKPYILKDGVTYGTTLKLLGLQIISVNGQAGVDTGDMDATEVAELFGNTKGFKASDPNVTINNVEDEEDDF